MRNMKLKSLAFLFVCSSLLMKAQTTSSWNGSGVVLSAEGYIATSNHTLEPGYHFEIDVFTNGVKKTYRARLEKADPVNDLAILKIDDPLFESIGAVPFTYKVKDVNTNEKIFLMGYPTIDTPGETVKVSEGIISAKSGYQNEITQYLVSCTIRPGYGGAPVFDNAGNLIGIKSSMNKSSQNTGYVVKISCLHNLLETLPQMPSIPAKTTISGSSFSDKTAALSKFIVAIRVKKEVMPETISKGKKMVVGQAYGGGIIFYVDNTGEHGLIASNDDGNSKRAQWGCDDLLIDETGTGIGSGQENTKKIILVCRKAGSEKIAARLCDQLVLDGYSDWFLPSKEELNLLYEQKEIIGGYEHGYYWSSSEFATNFAWYQHFDFGFQDYLNKDFSYFYRPVRAF